MTDEKLKEIEARYNSFPDPIGQGPTQSQARILFNQQLEKDIPALIKAIRDRDEKIRMLERICEDNDETPEY